MKTMAKQLDVRGEICPYPMMHTVQALKKLPAGEILEVITDHAPALETIPTQGARLGYDYTIEETGTSEWRITLTPRRRID
jgi:tRNA 2-thiouridine synthesizing protein A